MQVEKGLTVVDIDGKQAQIELEKLRNRAEQVKDELNQLRKAKADPKLIKQVEREYAGVRKELNKTKRETIDVKKVMDNLSGSSLRDVERAYRKIRTERKAMSREDKNYKSIVATEKRLKAEVDKTNASFRAQRSVISKVGDGFNKYFGLITAGAASMAGLVMGARKAINAFRELDEKFADVMKTTGLTRDGVETLNNSIAKIDTRTSQLELLDLARVAGKLGITAESEILGFVRAADKVGVALAEDLGGDVEQSVNQLGKLVEIFGISDEFGIEDSIIKIGSTINSLGAVGTSNEQYMIEFAKRLGGIAPVANISAAEVFGLGATLDELGQTSEVSSTAITKVIGEMFTKTGKYARLAGMDVSEFSELLDKDANEAFIQILKSAKGSGDGFSELAQNLNELGLDGARAIGTFSVLANNIDLLRERQAFSNDEFNKGTSLIEEFNVKNNTATAKLEKARKKIKQLSVELGQKLQPAMTHIVSKSTMMLKFLSTFVDFISKHGAALGKLVIAITAYTAAQKIASKWDDIVLKGWLKLEAIKNKLTHAYKMLTSQTYRATEAQKGLSKSMSPTAWGVIAAAVALVVTQIVKMIKKQREIKKTVNEVNTELMSQTQSFSDLFDILEKAPESSDAYKNAMKKLNEEYGNYLEYQVTDNLNQAQLNALKARGIELMQIEAVKRLKFRLEKEVLDDVFSDIAKAQANMHEAIAASLNKSLEASMIISSDMVKKIKNDLYKIDEIYSSNVSEFEQGRAINWDWLRNDMTEYFNLDEKLSKKAVKRILALRDEYGYLNDKQKEINNTVKLMNAAFSGDTDTWLAMLPEDIDSFTDASKISIREFVAEYQTAVDQAQDIAEKERLINDFYNERARLIQTLDRLKTPDPNPSPNGDNEDGDGDDNGDSKAGKSLADIQAEKNAKLLENEKSFRERLYAMQLSGYDAEILAAGQKYDQLIEQNQQYIDYWSDQVIAGVDGAADELEIALQNQQQLYDAHGQAVADINEKYRKQEEQKRQSDLEKQKAELLAKYDMVKSLAADIGAAFGAALDAQENKEKEFLKASLSALLKYLKDYLQLQIFKVTVGSLTTEHSIATAGVSGLAQAAAMTVALEAAYALATKGINQWDTGKYPVIGANDGKSYNASFVGTPKTGLYSSPSLGLFNEDPKRPEMVIDSKTTEQLRFNFPHVIDTIYRVAGKQFDSGQYPDTSSVSTDGMPSVSNQQSDINSQQLTSLIENQKALAKSIAILNNQLSRGIGVNYDKLKTADTEIDNIHSKASRS